MRSPVLRAASLAAALVLPALPATAQDSEERTAPETAMPETDMLETGGSFLDTFEAEQLDRERWYVAEGWVNTPDHDCTWSATALSKPGDRLIFEIEREPTAERDFVCAEVQSTEVYGHGTYEVRMRASDAPGTLAAFFTYTGPYFGDPHDEIDIELPGARPESVELNTWVDGDDFGGPDEITPGFDASRDFHDYAFEWTPDAIRFFVDGEQVGEVTDPAQIPTSPGKIFLTLYSGRGAYEPWLGRFRESESVPTMAVERVAYTAPGEPCQFPESIVCEGGR
ncbi:family 16 glycosylhydrolase [Salinarimonas ramus]|uniref:Endo-1,3-1,4-beta-glycanase n=1 Tax=Salinarimonas ramus TaxID=690164 RepID=A0A917V4Z8_9HYPH|nr:family 16 glycosylhydrolase [Salinarimonas ramus]GGK38214.1 endo-1,3-1,4-beta-glycanase [Salinarimonas ramus]